MRIFLGLTVALTLSGAARAVCPPDCVLGGGPAATDCFVAWGGISSTIFSCVDGEPTCDTDGKADGVCLFALQGCINVAGSAGCTPGTLSGPPTVKPASSAVAQALAGNLGALDPAAPGCSAPGLAVPLKISLAGIKPGVAKLVVTAVSSGKRDKDRLRLACQPNLAPPSFSTEVQAIFTASCATTACHTKFNRAQGLSLEPDEAYDAIVGKPSTEVRKLAMVTPGSVKRSFLARKLLSVGLPPLATGFAGRMPSGCPVATPCLTDAQIFTILSWIANGAPRN